MIKIVAEKLWWFFTEWLSDRGAISFGRGMSLLLTLYFCGQDAWFFHRTGHLVDNATLLTQAGLMTMFYFQTAAKQTIINLKGDTTPPTP